MKASFTQHIRIAGILGTLALFCIVATLIITYEKHNVVLHLEEKIKTYTNELITMSEITDRNGADEVTERIMNECPRRDDFEAYLVRLGSLNQQELLTMQNLFDSCGFFYAERKALMVVRLERSLDGLKENIETLDILKDVGVYTDTLHTFEEITRLERERSTLLTDQAGIQRDIIKLLITGSKPQSNDVISLVAQAQEIAQSLTVADQRIDTLRSSLKP